MQVRFTRPMVANTLTSAVRQLTGADERVKAAETELNAARADLTQFQERNSLEALRRQCGGKKMSAYGIWILCVPPIAGMYLAGNCGLGLPAFIGGFVATAAGFLLMSRSAKAEAVELHRGVAGQEGALKQRVTELETRYRRVCDESTAGPQASIQQDEKKVVVNGVPLAKRKERL